VYSGAVAMGGKPPPPGPVKSIDFRGFQAPTDAEHPSGM